MDPEDVQSKLKLSADEDFVLTAWQYRMMQRDIAASKGKALQAKRLERDKFRGGVIQALADHMADERSAEVADLIRRVDPAGAEPDLEVLESAGPAASSVISKRSRALLLLIDLYVFEPWDTSRWDKTARGEALSEVHDTMGPLRSEDLNAISVAYADALKKLGRSTSWKRSVALAGAGLGLGVLTGGLAAPAIAGAYGTFVLGYSGAVAASAGMAALGGGSIAAGGLGMAGGAALITGLTGAVGAGAATVGGKITGITAVRVAADAVRLHVVTQVVLRDVEGDEDAAKAVIVSLRERVANLGVAFATLTDRYEAVRTQLESRQREVDIERAKRLDAEARLARLRTVAERLKDRMSGPEDSELEALQAELDLLKAERKATKALTDGINNLAEDLEPAA